MEDFLFKWAQMIYYIGAGLVLIGTGLRFLWRFVKGFMDDRDFLNELREVHLTNIYEALKAIAHKLQIDLDLPQPPQP